nr:hypothetical protein 8 [bacterium]
MLMDQNLMFLDETAITGSAASDVVPLDAARDIGVGENLWLYIKVDETMDDAGDDSTVTFSLQTDDNDGFTSATTLRTFDTIPANTAAGTEYKYRLDPAAYEEYLRLYATVANGDLSAGKFTAAIVKDVPAQTDYASGYSF